MPRGYQTLLAALLIPGAAVADQQFLEHARSWPLTEAPADIAITLKGFNPALGALTKST